MAQRIVMDYSVDLEFKKTSHILGMAFSEKWQILGLVATDGRIFFYQSKHQANKFVLKRLLVIDASELTIQTNIWYMEKHDAWLTTGKDNIVREWSIMHASLLQDETQDSSESTNFDAPLNRGIRTGKSRE